MKFRVCDPLYKSSLKCCCRLALVGQTIRAVAALVRRPVVPAFILLFRCYASAQAQIGYSSDVMFTEDGCLSGTKHSFKSSNLDAQLFLVDAIRLGVDWVGKY